MEFYDQYAEHMSPLLAPYFVHLMAVKRLVTNSYSAAEASLDTGGKINHSATHEDVIHWQMIDQVFADPQCHDLRVLYPLFIVLQNIAKYKAIPCAAYLFGLTVLRTLTVRRRFSILRNP
jgi:hypothetical protein